MSKARVKKINLNKVCRCCLSDKGTLKDIMQTKLPMMLSVCASIELSEDDSLPQQVCIPCFRMISKFYVFKKKVLRCDTLLRNFARRRQKVKDFSDILDKAVNEAEITIGTEEIVYEVAYQSEDDVPLIERKENWEKSTFIKVMNLQRDIEEQENEVKSEILKFASEEPPPLVPLDTNKKVDDDLIHVTQESPATPPPLIPIKTTGKIVNDLTIVEKNNIKLNCSMCSSIFTSVAALKEHKRQSCKVPYLHCTICQKEFTDRKKLIGHLKGHMVVKEHLCKLCGKCYPNNSTLQVHMRTHTGERPFRCQICDKGFVRWAGVVAHMRTHTKNKSYVCNVCEKAFSVRSNLTRHKILHSGVLPFCCNYCGKTFSQSDNLQLHIRTYHTLEKPFLCNECGKGFVSATRLKRHMWVHSGYKPYHCKHCSKAYSNSNDLKIHERSHKPSNEADKPHVCHICNMRFFHSCRLLKHLKVHDKSFTCNDCGKAFSSEEILKKHIAAKHVVMMNSILVDSNIVFLEEYNNTTS